MRALLVKGMAVGVAALILGGCQTTAWQKAPTSDSIVSLEMLEAGLDVKLEKQVKNGVTIDKVILNGGAGDIMIMDMIDNAANAQTFKGKIDDVEEFKKFARSAVPNFDSRNVEPKPLASQHTVGGWYVKLKEDGGLSCYVAHGGYVLTKGCLKPGLYDTIVKTVLCGGAGEMYIIESFGRSVTRRDPASCR